MWKNTYAYTTKEIVFPDLTILSNGIQDKHGEVYEFPIVMEGVVIREKYGNVSFKIDDLSSSELHVTICFYDNPYATISDFDRLLYVIRCEILDIPHYEDSEGCDSSSGGMSEEDDGIDVDDWEIKEADNSSDEECDDGPWDDEFDD